MSGLMKGNWQFWDETLLAYNVNMTCTYKYFVIVAKYF